jgi:hypothetical protein
MEDPGNLPQTDPWEAEVKAMSDRLARESRRSGIIGFLGGAAVMGGVVILVLAVMNQMDKNKSLTTEVETKTQLASTAQQQATSARQQTATVTKVLGATVENLQAQSPDLSAKASQALDKAFDADPNAAKLLVRVYIHIHSKAQQSRASALAKALHAAGYLVPGIDVQPQIFTETRVHYYSSDSQSLADANAIAKVVAGTGIPVETLQVQAATTDKLRPRAYGLWLASDVQ